MNGKLLGYGWLMFGAVMQGTAMSLFLFPHSIPSGGAAGLAILANYWFDLPLGFALWLVNIIFLLFALKYFGYSWTLRTIFAVALSSTTVSILSAGYSFPHVHLLIDLVFGSFLFGLGVGILIRSGASSGGMVIPSLMIAGAKGWRPGSVMLSINLFIFLFTAAVIDFTIIFYAVICQVLSTRVINFVYQFQFTGGNFVAFGWRKK